MRIDMSNIEAGKFRIPFSQIPESEIDLGFFLYCRMARTDNPSATDADLVKWWNKENPMARSLMKELAYAVGEEAIERYKKKHNH